MSVTSINSAPEHPWVVVYFDGVCGLCNQFVDFLIEKDKKDRLRFSPLQSALAQKRVPAPYLAGDLSTLVVEFQGKLYFKSQGALLALAQLGGGYHLLKLGRLVPHFLADLIYDYMARHRYAWFGRTETCRLPSVSEKHKFLD